MLGKKYALGYKFTEEHKKALDDLKTINKEAELLKKQNNFQDAVNYLVLALEHAKNIKPDVEVKLYYDILTLYDNLGQKEQKEIYLQKCKNVKIEENFYKNMCNGINP